MGEKFKSMIERDIAVVLLLVLGGLAYSRDGARGFPLPWLCDGKAETGVFLMDLAILAGIVMAVDVVTMIAKGVAHSGDLARGRELRKAYKAKQLSMPKPGVMKNKPFSAGSGRSVTAERPLSQASTSVSSSEAGRNQGPGSKEMEFLEKMREANKDFEKRTSLKARQQRGRNKKSNPTAAMVIAVIAASVMMIAAMIPDRYSFEDDSWYEDNGWDQIDWVADDSAEADAVNLFCSEALEALANGDADWLSGIGSSGDAQALIDMTGWSAAETEGAKETNLIFSGDRGGLVRRYQVTTDDGVYWLAFKFVGTSRGEYAYEEDDVALTGIAACKVPDWLMQPADDFKETYEGEYLDSVFSGDLQPDEDDYDRLVDYIATHQIFVGEDEADDLILMSM